jgi:hypothetical protein
MNIENAIALRDLVSSETTSFDMSSYLSAYPSQEGDSIKRAIGCGTAACLAGHVAFMVYPEATITDDGDYVEIDGVNVHVFDLASELLEIDHDDAYTLFFTWNWPTWAVNRAIAVGERQAAIDLLDYFIQKEQS